MKILGFIVAIVIFYWLMVVRHNLKMEAFCKRAFEKFLLDENSIALHYILIAYSLNNKNVSYLWHKAQTNITAMPEDPQKQILISRMNKILERLQSTECGYAPSSALKKRLTDEYGSEYFHAWRKFDISIFDRL